MALKSAKFKTLEVRQFLNRNYPYAAQCFAQDHQSEEVASMEVEKWFKKYFAAEVAYSEYRNLECTATQFANFA
jgi:hypothetical protein